LAWDWWIPHVSAIVLIVVSTITGYVTLAKHYRERNQATVDERRRWSIEIGPASAEGWSLAQLKRNEIGAVSVRLLTMEVRSPRKVLMAIVATDSRGGLVGYGGSITLLPNLATATTKLVINLNLSPERGWANDRQTRIPLSYSMFTFFVSSPPSSSFWRRHKSRRLMITAEAEETSSARRNIRINVTSQPIDWIARAAQSAG
jgi:hypothetical protein